MNGNFFQSILTPTTQPNIHCITSTDFTRGGSLEDHLPTNNGFKRIRQEEEDEQGGEGEGIENYLPEQQHHTQQRQHINSFPLGYKTKAKRSTFIRIHPSPNSFTTSVYKPNGESVYKKITEESLLNIKRVDQVTFSSSPERFFIGEGAKITMTGEGHFINLWRCNSDGKLVISQSFAFIDSAEYGFYHQAFKELDN